jgi:hypothetical protein
MVTGLAIGCAESSKDGQSDANTPHLLALSAYSGSLGTPIEAFMSNPPPGDARKIELVFNGTFTQPNGTATPVSITQETTRTEAGAMRWTTLGPFSNPFLPNKPDIGVFSGKAGVRVTNADGSTTDDANPIPMNFEVRPSIVITDLQPTTATCAQPALRLIGNMSYKMKAETIGFNATHIDYSFTTPSMAADDLGKPVLDFNSDGKMITHETKLSHPLVGNADAVAGSEALRLPPVPDNVNNYGVVFAVTASDDAGHSVTSVFGMTAHRPLEVYYDGRYELSQIYPATPVSGCMPGGQQGRSATYTESHAEQKSRTLSLTLSRSLTQSNENNWSTSDGKTVEHGTTNTDGYSHMHGTENSFTFSQEHSDSNGVSTNWSDGDSMGGSAGVGFDFFASVSASGNYEHNSMNGGGSEHSSNDGWSKGTSNSTLDQSTTDHQTATTDSTSVQTTNTKGGSQSTQDQTGINQDNSWTVQSTDTIDRNYQGTVIAGTWGTWYRQMVRFTRRAFVLEFNKCGQGDVMGDMTLQDYTWAPDLALGEKCPPFPQTNFPAPQCFTAPCDP